MRIAQRLYKQPVFIVGLSAILSVFAAFVISTQGIAYGGVVIFACVAIPVAYYTITNVQVGITATFVLSFTLAFINRVFSLYKYPLGTVFDLLIVMMVVGLIIKYKQEPSIFKAKNPIGLLLLVWVIFNVLQLFNPSAPSTLGWVMAAKSNLYPVIFFFIFYYTIDSFKFVHVIIKIWFGLVFLAALYSFKQRYIGLAGYESFVYTNELKRSLYITWGNLRVFSFLNDPMSYAMVLMYSLVLAFGYFFVDISKQKKILLAVFFFIVLLSLLLTGTRTAYFLLPVGIIVFGLITLNKKILAFVSITMVIGTAVVFTSSHPQLHIFKTAFRGSEDPSMNVRLRNQELIRPYIESKPFGWGLASTGGFGRTFNAGSFIGNFPPDSEYVRIAIENGWIGLLAWLLILFLIFRKGLADYFTVKDKRAKIYFASYLALFYVIIVAQYPQEALRVPPTGIISGFVMAMLARLRDLSSPTTSLGT